MGIKNLKIGLRAKVMCLVALFPAALVTLGVVCHYYGPVRSAVVAGLLVVLALLIGWYAANRVSVQVRELTAAVTRAAGGDLDHHIDRWTGDGIEGLAEAFNMMVDRMKEEREIACQHAAALERANARLAAVTEDLSGTNTELTSLKDALAGKVAERTQYLVETQEAVINMMEDLQSSKEEIERSSAETRYAYEELKEAQRKLLESEKLAALGRFSAGIAHEVKNPLAIMLGGMEYLDAKLATTDEDIKAVLVKIRDAILRADKVLQNLLRFARPAKLVTEVTSPEALVEGVLTLFGYKFPAINIRIEIKTVDKGMHIDVDKGQIEQVLFNLMINAMDAMPEGGVITLSIYRAIGAELLQEKKSVCVIEVADTGAGISAENLVRLFEPFFTTKRDMGGTGLGLTISRSIIEAHGGALAVESEEGKGTSVKIMLPLAEKD